MKKNLNLKTLLVLIVALSVFACSNTAQNKADLKTHIDSVSYAIGCYFGSQIKDDTISGIQKDKVNEGFKAVVFGDKPAFTKEQIRSLLQAFGAEMQRKSQEASMKQAEGEKQKGQAFLEENKKKSGIKVTASGLQYEVIKEGTGDSPKATDEVTVHYKGTLLDGKTFDSSYDRNEPAKFVLNQVIPGWTEGVQLMKKGGKYKFYIPSNLAYGDQAVRGIPGGSTLTFEVELIDFVSK